MFNYKQLLAFATIVEEGSFSKAAKKLYITQPAISSQIKAMEKELAVVLIERGERGVILTAAGDILYKNSKIILNQYKVLADTMAQYKSTSTGKIRIAASTIPGEYLLPKYMYDFKKKNSDVKLYLTICDSKCVLEKVQNGEVSLGVIGFMPREVNIEAVPFVEEKLKLICSSSTAFDAYTPLNQYPHILREEGSGTREVVVKHMEESGFSLENDFDYTVLGSTRSTLTAVEQGLGIAWVSEHAIGDALKLNKVKCAHAKYDIERAFYVITQKNRTLSPLDAAFKHHLSQTAKL